MPSAAISKLRRRGLLPLVSLLIVAAVAAALWLGVDYDRRLASAREAVETQNRLANLLSTLQDAQVGQRGYLLTSDLDYLRPYDRARRALPGRIAEARAAIGGDPLQRRSLARFETVSIALLDELAQTIALHRSGQREAALAIVQTGLGRQLLEEARGTAAALSGREDSVLAQTSREAAKLGRLLLILLLLSAAFAILALLWSLREARTRSVVLREAVKTRTAELKAAKDSLELVYESATDYAIVTTDRQGLITRWNTGARNVFGWAANEMIGRPAEIIFTPEDLVIERPQTEMALARDTGRASDERWHVRKDGSRFWAAGELQPLRAPDETLIGFLKIVRDRTVEKREKDQLKAGREEAESQVRQLHKMEGLGQLTAGIAHDFNNMLAVVIGAVDMARRRLTSDPARIPALLDAAHEGAERAAVLTRRLLAFSRQQPLAPVVLDVNALVSGMSDLLMRTLGEAIEVETVLAGGLWNVEADRHEIENILINLAVNARDAMPGGGKLTVETANAHLDDQYARDNIEIAPGQYVALCVTDSGAGMPPDVVARAFDPFFTTKAPGKGTGLGLSQLYGFAKQSGGHAKIYSEEGHGTTVKLYLPRHYGAERVAAPKPDQGVSVLPRGRPAEIILVAEDEERVRMISVDTLRELGYTVLHAADGSEALELLAANPGVALLFTDIVMPGMTGRALADRAVERDPALKVLFTTGYTRNAVVHGGTIDAGVAFIAKPFTLEQIAIKVRAVLDGGGANRPA